jgi:hypothetical protein
LPLLAQRAQPLLRRYIGHDKVRGSGHGRRGEEWLFQ